MSLNAVGGKTQKDIKKLIAPGYSIKAFNELLKDVNSI